MPSVVPCPLRVDALFEMLGPDELLKVGLAGELECARHEGLWRSLCRERVLGIWSGPMTASEFKQLGIALTAGDVAAKGEASPQWRKLFLQSRQLEPRWSRIGESRTARKGQPSCTMPKTLLMSGRDLLFVECYFSCAPACQRIIKPAVCREVLPLDLEACAANFPSSLHIPLNVQFGSRYMEFADRYCASLELRLCARIDGQVTLVCDTGIDDTSADDDVDRDGVGTYHREFVPPHSAGGRLRASFTVRQLKSARVAMVDGEPKRMRAVYVLDAISISDSCQTSCAINSEQVEQRAPVGHGPSCFRALFTQAL